MGPHGMRGGPAFGPHGLVCRGRPPEPPFDDERAPSSDAPEAARAARRMQVRRLDRGPTPPPDVTTVRLVVALDDAPLGSVAVALADATGASVLVDPEVASARVTLAMRDADLETVVAALAAVSGAVSGRQAGAVYLQAPRRARRRAREAALGQEQAVVETRLVPADGVAPAALATTFCEMIASPRGSAAVIGRFVLVRDGPTVLAQLDALIESLRARPRPGPRGGPRRPPPPPPD